MNSAVVLLFGVLAMLGGYLFYSKFFAKHILGLDNSIPTPAHTMKDGIDYVPTNKYVLWGHHFTSEPPRDCQRLIYLREYDNENTKLYPRNERARRPYAN